jgi:mannosyltransferase
MAIPSMHSNSATPPAATLQPASQPRRARWIDYLAALTIFTGVILRLWIKFPTDFWEDEIIAVTHAVQPTWAVVVDTIRNDIHPPLYFLQLHVWSLISDSDVWFMSNSIFWSLFGLGSFYWTISKRFGQTVGLASSSVYAVMPSPVYLADQMRMYAMLAALLIWAWHFATRVFENRDDRALPFSLLIFLQCAIILTHALGAVAIACLGIYALAICRDVGEGYKKWLACYGPLAVITLPWIFNAAVHGGNVESTSNAHGLALMFSSSTVGITAQINRVAKIAGIFIFACLLLFAFHEKKYRLILLCFTALPLGAALIGSVMQPFYKWNFFSTVQAPFIAVIVGHAISQESTRLRILATVCLILFFGISLETKIRFRETSHLVAASNFIRANYRRGDVILVPQQSYFHGLAWYLDGPHWGSPLKIAPPPSPPWQKVYARLGPTLVRKLDLMPDKTIIEDKPFSILTGTAPSKDAPNAQRYWLVSISRADLPENYPPKMIGSLRKQFSVGKSIHISLYADRRQTIMTQPSGL